jgi:hypothetical protein
MNMNKERLPMPRLSRYYTTELDDLPVRILSEFDDQPGLQLTFSQIRRLWDVSEIDCQEALDYLTGVGLLRRSVTGRYYLVRVAV